MRVIGDKNQISEDVLDFRGFSPFPAGPNFGPVPNPKKYTFFPIQRFFFPIAHYKKEIAMDILFHPFIPIHQINSPRTPYVSVIYFVCKRVVKYKSKD